MALPRVDFPHPDSPTKPRVSPLYNLKLKDSLNETIQSINEILGQVKTIVDEVTNGASQVADVPPSTPGADKRGPDGLYAAHDPQQRANTA